MDVVHVSVFIIIVIVYQIVLIIFLFNTFPPPANLRELAEQFAEASSAAVGGHY